jgi:chromosome segregation ATPase
VLNLRGQVKSYEEKMKQLVQEMICKDEQNAQLKLDLSTIQEKYKAKSEDVVRLEVESQNLNQKCQFLTEETKKLESSLDKSRDNGERLHKESEMVIANVNSWVHEQRYDVQIIIMICVCLII